MKKLSLPVPTLFLGLLALSGMTLPLGAQETPGFAGHWEGAIVTPNGDIGIDVDLIMGEPGPGLGISVSRLRWPRTSPLLT